MAPTMLDRPKTWMSDLKGIIKADPNTPNQNVSGNWFITSSFLIDQLLQKGKRTSRIEKKVIYRGSG
jgi:hypothetical protein